MGSTRRAAGSAGRNEAWVPRLIKLPWIPDERQWLDVLAVAAKEAIRNRVMLALAYDAALRREELCTLQTEDLDRGTACCGCRRTALRTGWNAWCRTRRPPARPGPGGQIAIKIGDLYNLHDLTAAFPVHRLTVLAGPSGAGETALVLDGLIPAARALLSGSAPPGRVRSLELGGIRQAVEVDAAPISQNARSTRATYCGAFDQIRRVFAETAYARRRRWKPGHFSFNTREGQCPTCRGPGGIDLDVQYLPDITVQCPTCHGARFNDATLAVRAGGLTIADVLGLTVGDALERSPSPVNRKTARPENRRDL